jgi:hypothetical protein
MPNCAGHIPLVSGNLSSREGHLLLFLNHLIRNGAPVDSQDVIDKTALRGTTVWRNSWLPFLLGIRIQMLAIDTVKHYAIMSSLAEVVGMCSPTAVT